MNLLLDYVNERDTNVFTYREAIINDIVEIHKGNFSGDINKGIGIKRYYQSTISEQRLKSIIYNQINLFVVSLQEISIIDDNINIIYD